MKNNWVFPHGKDLTPRGVNDPAINSFLDNVIDSLTREVIQNSLDAKIRENNNPVIVSFEFSKIKTNDIPKINRISEFALPKAEEFWRKKGNAGTIDYLNSFREVLESDEIRVLKISDFNTYGLNERSYDALVLGNGYTEKIDENAAGSKGIGKAAPFAISDLRMVFYNTVPTEVKPRHVGVMNFVSFNFDEKDESIITQERALFQEEDISYIPGQISFNSKSREDNQFGTDIFILGVREIEDDWEKKILLSTVNNFLVSILDNKLIVKVNDKCLNKENVKEIIEELADFKKTQEENKIFKNTLNYFDALTNENRKEFNLDERFKKYPFINSDNDGKLILLKREDANRSILQTRISGMKIYDRKNISGNILFTGVFRAVGTDLDKFLKSLENTNHTDWSPDQASTENRKLARSLLKDLFDWFKETVKGAYEQSVDEVIDAIGMSDFLPLLTDEGTGEEQKESGIKKTIDSIKIKRNTKKNLSYSSYENSEEGIDSILGELGLDTTSSSNSKSKNKKSVKKKSVLQRLNLRNRLRKEELVESTEFFGIKLVALNSKEGLYRCILKPKNSCKEIELRINYVGEDGSALEATIAEVKSTTNKVKLKDSQIRVLNIKKNTLTLLDLKVDSSLLLKMEGQIYEVKV